MSTFELYALYLGQGAALGTLAMWAVAFVRWAVRQGGDQR